MSELVSKREMSEEDIKLRYITPAIESKWDRHNQMRMEYAEILDVPFVYSSNGDAFLEHDMKN